MSVSAELDHPVKLSFFPTISISLILLGLVALDHLPVAAEPLILTGATLHLASTLTVLNWWFNKQHFEPVHLNPAWFIPIVGNVLVPVATARLGYVEIGWFFFSIGIVFWLVLLTIIINRVVFHHPLPERLAPTLCILIAPPAVGFLSWVALTGQIDAAARVLYYFALFMTLFVAVQTPRLARARFFLSWWAYSFPLAAVTIASWVMYERTNAAPFLVIATVLLTAVTIVVTGLVVRTLLAIANDEICRPE